MGGWVGGGKICQERDVISDIRRFRKPLRNLVSQIRSSQPVGRDPKVGLAERVAGWARARVSTMVVVGLGCVCVLKVGRSPKRLRTSDVH